MTIKVSEALDSDTAELAQVQRFDLPTKVNGVYRRPESVMIPAFISMQQPTPRQLEALEENERTKDTMLFISSRRLLTSDEKTGTVADIIHRKGNKYKVVASGDWNEFGHTTGFCARIK